MGKIRVATLGDEKAEKKQKQKAEKRRQEKTEGKAVEKTAEEAPQEVKTTAETHLVEKKKQYKKESGSKRVESKRHKENTSLVDETKTYSLSDGLALLDKMKKIKFDETVELHINTTESGVAGSLTLPHGTGKHTRVAIIAPAKDPKAAEALIAEIQSGKINFDVLVATPDAMPKLARIAKILGPRGLMPNPKAGTVTTKPEDVAKKYEGGQINFKTEAKLPLLHLSVGKVSFGKDKLTENIKTAVTAVQTKNIKNVTLKSTMSAGIRIQV